MCKVCVINKYALYLYQQKQIKLEIMTNAITITKLQITEVPAEYQKEEGCIAFQLVQLSYSFYGNIVKSTHDTKILKNGDQIIHGGNGFIKDGFKIN